MEKDTNQFKFKLSQIAFIFILPVLAFITSCNNDDEGNTGPKGDENSTILDVVKSVDELSTFFSATSNFSDITASLDDESETFTVFAPTDNAFSLFQEAMGYSSLDDISEDTLREIIEYHILSGSDLAGTDFTDGQTLETLLSGEFITVTVNGSTIRINSATIAEPDVNASNGTIHILDAVLVPASLGGTGSSSSSIMNVVEAARQLSTLEEALQKFSELSTSLDEEGSYTLFAPTNDAFADLMQALGYTSLDEVPQDVLLEILQYHISSQAFMAGDFADGQTVSTMLADESVTMHVKEGALAANSSTIISADIKASNGVIHIVNSALIPSYLRENLTTVLDLARQNEDLSLFVEYIENYPELRSTVDGFSGDFTFFAPTNYGFQTLLNITGQDQVEDVPLALMQRFLKYHVADAAIMTDELSVGSSLNTLIQGEVLTVGPDTISGSGFLINRSQIVESDMKADNGVLHVITGFLFPSKEARAVNSVLEPVYFNKNFSTLNAAIEKADMFRYFTDRPNRYTFFAPDNSGFEKAGIGSLENLSVDNLATILKYHIHEDSAHSEASLLNAGTVSTPSGEISISGSSGSTLLNGSSQITESDIENDNGVTHIIDHVLMPEY